MITGDAKQVADTVGRELGVDEVFAVLSETYRLVLISKGDLLVQERKLADYGVC